MEWPARAVINCIWPGLPEMFLRKANATADMNDGFIFLGRIPPVVETVLLDVGRKDSWYAAEDPRPLPQMRAPKELSEGKLVLSISQNHHLLPYRGQSRRSSRR
jgi:hypothetical protein